MMTCLIRLWIYAKNIWNFSIPKSYIEDFPQYRLKANELPLPNRPKYIFTSNYFDTDETFKIWVALKIEDNVPYFVAQHGGNYGTHLYYGRNFWPERETASIFFSWGWEEQDTNTMPLGNQVVFRRTLRQKRNRSKLLILKHSGLHNCIPADTYFQSFQGT